MDHFIGSQLTWGTPIAGISGEVALACVDSQGDEGNIEEKLYIGMGRWRGVGLTLLELGSPRDWV